MTTPTTTTLTVVLPLPARILHPNARAHWAPKSAATKEHRTWAMRMCGVAIGRERVTPYDRAITITRTFYVPDKRPRDLDGLEASCKAYQDGIADALGVNDRHFRYEPSRIIVERGRRYVEFRIEVQG